MLCLPLLPFLRGVLTLVLLTFGDDLALSEHFDGRSNAFIEIFLIDFNPVGIVGLSANLDTLKDLLFLGLQCWEIFWGEHICRTMKTGQFRKFTDQFGCFEAVS
jgi:hypothetical protein